MTKCLIHSLVFSRLIYLCSLLCNLPVNIMYKRKCIQRRAIRVLYKLKFALIVSISDLMRSLGWLKFRYICIHICTYITYRLLCIIHKAIHRGFPEYLDQSITIHSSKINYIYIYIYIYIYLLRYPYRFYSHICFMHIYALYIKQ